MRGNAIPATGRRRALWTGRVMVLLSIVSSAAACLADVQGGVLRLTLPPEFYAVPGVETSIYRHSDKCSS